MSRRPRALRRLAIALPLCVLAIALSGCASYPYIPWRPVISPALGEERDGYGAIRVFYATDRNLIGAANTDQLYGGDRTRELKLGVCEVSIPPRHGIGRLEEPDLFESPSPHSHVTLTSVSPPLQSTAFFDELRAAVAHSHRHELFVFVHGYAVTFGEAVRRTGQMAHDVEFDGAAIVYSWAAQGSLLSYLVDAGNAEWTERYLVDFLEQLARDSGAENIHLVAHSMGTRVLVRALRELVRRAPNTGLQAFDEVVLAAADFDADLFVRDYVPDVTRVGRRLTIYASRADWALGSAQFLYRYERLGNSVDAIERAGLAQQLDLIDATQVDKGTVGHMYYGNSPSILRDLSRVLCGCSATDRGLSRSESGACFTVPPLGEIAGFRLPELCDGE